MRPSRWVPARFTRLQRLLRLFRAEPRRVGDHHLGEPDDGVERRAQLVAHAGEELRLVLAGRFELLIEPPQLLAHPVDVGRQRAQLVAIDDMDALRESRRPQSGRAALRSP